MRFKKWFTDLEKSIRAKASPHVIRGIGMAVAILVTAVALVMVARQSSQPADEAASKDQTAKEQTAKAVVDESPKNSSANYAPTKNAAKRSPGDGAAKAAPESPAAPKLAPAARVEPESAAASAKVTAEPVTITGCLEERDNETFQLRDTSGTDVPKSRSWKSAFLKKRPASVTVNDTSNRLKLGNHVGERVVVTGTLINREMQVRSLHRVAPSCV